MIESGLPVRNYTAELRLDDAGAGASKETWSARFDPVDAGDEQSAKAIRSFLKAGVDALAKRFARKLPM
jgi:hypothetical protein